MSDTPPPTPLTPAERTILGLIRDGAHDAEIAVRVGMSIGDVKQRIERLIARSGARDRAALGALSEADILSRANERQAWGPDGAEDASPGPPEPEPVPPRRVSRRQFVLGALGSVATIGVAGGGAYLALRNEGSAPAGPDSETPSASPSPGTTPTADIVSRIERLNGLGPIQRTTFDRGETIDVPDGALVFVSPVTGAAEAYHFEEDAFEQFPAIVSNDNQRVLLRDVGAPSGSPRGQYILDRAVGSVLSVPLDTRVLALAGEFAIVAPVIERGASAGLLDGEYVVLSLGGEPRALVRFAMDGGGSEYPLPLLAADGTHAAIWVPTPVGQKLALFKIDGENSDLLMDPDAELWHVAELLRSGSGIAFITVEWAEPEEDPETDPRPTSTYHRVAWSGEDLASPVEVPGNAAHVSPDQRFIAFQRSLRSAGGGYNPDDWPAVYVQEIDGDEPLFRVRSAVLQYGDALDGNRWLSDSSGVAVMIGTPPESPTLATPALLTFSGVVHLPEPPVRPGTPLTGWAYDGPVPCPANIDLIAFGHVAVYNRITAEWIAPEVPSATGLGHLAPWSGDGSELVFTTGHGGHGGPIMGILLEPKLEYPPFTDDMRFRINTPGTCLNMRPEPTTDADIVICVEHDTIVVLVESGDPAREPNRQAVEFTSVGAWVHVEIEGSPGVRGWVVADYLAWA